MSREEFIELCEQLRPFITRNALQIREHHPLKKNFALALDFLKDAVSITMTANTFRLHQSTASKIVMEVCNAAVAYLAPKSITLPNTKDEIYLKISEFAPRFGMLLA